MLIFGHLVHACGVSYGDRPFNLKGGGYGFLFRSEFFFQTTQELEYLFFLTRKAQIFFPGFNIRLYDKNSESDYFFPPPVLAHHKCSLVIAIYHQ